MERRFALPCVPTHALVLQEHELVVVGDSERIAVVGFDGVLKALKSVRVRQLVVLQDPVRLVTLRQLPADAEHQPRALEGLTLPRVAIECRNLDDLEVTASVETMVEVCCTSGPALFVGAAGRLTRFEFSESQVRETWNMSLWKEPTLPIDRLLALDAELAEAEEALMETVGEDDSFPEAPRGPAGARFRRAERALDRARESLQAERAELPTFRALAWSEDDGRLIAITDRSVLRVSLADDAVETLGKSSASSLLSAGGLFALDFAGTEPAWISLNDGARHSLPPLGTTSWRNLCLHPLERRVAVVEGAGVRIVDLLTGDRGDTYAPFRDGLALAAYSADGSMLFLASRGGSPAGLVTDTVKRLTTPIVQVMRAGATLVRLDAAGVARWSTHELEGVRELLCNRSRVAMLRSDEVLVFDAETSRFPAVKAHLNGDWLALLSQTADGVLLERVNLRSLAVERLPAPQLTERALICVSAAGTVVALERRGAGVQWSTTLPPRELKVGRPIPVSAAPRFSTERLLVPRTLDLEVDATALPRTHTESITLLAVSPGEGRAASASSAEVVVWDLEHLRPIARFALPARLSSLAIADDGLVDLVDDLRGHTVLDPTGTNAGAAL
ncbi:MAG: hypothetical protein JNM69_02495 [Archangium sp.]|nr:hypothetical protein [Archangium sp.]